MNTQNFEKLKAALEVLELQYKQYLNAEFEVNRVIKNVQQK